MVHLVKFLCLGKKRYEQKRSGWYFAQNQFLEYLLELEGKLEFVWDNIFSEL